MEWYQAEPKSDWHASAPSKEKRGEEVDEDGGAGEGLQTHWALLVCLIWSNEPLQPDTEDRQADVGDKQGLNSIRTGLHLNLQGQHLLEPG